MLCAYNGNCNGKDRKMIWRYDTVKCNGRTFLVTVKEITLDKKMAEVIAREWEKRLSVPFLNGLEKT